MPYKSRKQVHQFGTLTSLQGTPLLDAGSYDELILLADQVGVDTPVGTLTLTGSATNVPGDIFAIFAGIPFDANNNLVFILPEPLPPFLQVLVAANEVRNLTLIFTRKVRHAGA